MHWDQRCECQVSPKSPTALEDAQRTVGLVRLHAAEWHIDPHQIGVLGFAAGGHRAVAISTHFAHRLYPAVDAAVYLLSFSAKRTGPIHFHKTNSLLAPQRG